VPAEDGSPDGFSYGSGYGYGGYGYGATFVEDGEEGAEDDGEGGEDECGEKRRHECPKCGKKFNRPSSLKIHLNTHTGAKRESSS